MPLLTICLILANLAAYGLELAAGGLPACYAYGLIPAGFVQTGNLAPVFTSLFLHSPSDLFHLGGNLAFLLVFGVIVEGEIGSFGFGLLYALAGLAGGLVHVLVDPSATVPLVGASGAIAGLMAVAAALRPRFLGFAVAFVGVNLWDLCATPNDGVSAACHIGGFACGALFAMIIHMRTFVEEERFAKPGHNGCKCPACTRGFR